MLDATASRPQNFITFIELARLVEYLRITAFQDPEDVRPLGLLQLQNTALTPAQRVTWQQSCCPCSEYHPRPCAD
jgi:hypothetical protein